MINYDDFAMPSLENIENMAKAYSQMEKEYIKKSVLKNENANTLQKIYNEIFNSFNIVSKICELYPKNRKFLIIYEKLTKMKVMFESDFVDFNLSIPSESYTFSESTVIYDLVKIWATCVQLLITEVKDVLVSKKYVSDLIVLIKEIVKY